MKVGDLRTRLMNLDPNMDVLCHIEETYRPVQAGSVLEILECSVVEAEKFRLDDTDRTAGLKFNSSELSEPHLILEITTDF